MVHSVDVLSWWIIWPMEARPSRRVNHSVRNSNHSYTEHRTTEHEANFFMKTWQIWNCESERLRDVRTLTLFLPQCLNPRPRNSERQAANAWCVASGKTFAKLLLPIAHCPLFSLADCWRQTWYVMLYSVLNTKHEVETFTTHNINKDTKDKRLKPIWHYYLTFEERDPLHITYYINKTQNWRGTWYVVIPLTNKQ